MAPRVQNRKSFGLPEPRRPNGRTLPGKIGSFFGWSNIRDAQV